MKLLFRFLVIGILGAGLASAATADEIHDAAARGDVAALGKFLAADKSLLEKKGEWHNQEEGWRLVGTPLHIAAIYGQVDAVRFLVSKGADVNALDSEDFTPLALAAYLGRKETVEFLAKTKGVNIHAVTNEKKTALQLALEGFPLGEPVPHETRAAICEILLANGAKPNTADATKLTPLHVAVMREIPAAIKSLLAKGADVNAKDENDRTPLSIAEAEGLEEIAEILKKAGGK
jgi:ankyrin repeat protein